MKKENVKTVLAVNVVILTLIALNKAYKPVLDKLSEQYIKLKNENSRKSTNYKVATTKILKEAQEKVGPVKDLINVALTNHNIQETTETISKRVQNYLCEKWNAISEDFMGHVTTSSLQKTVTTSIRIDPNRIRLDTSSSQAIMDSTFTEITNHFLSYAESKPLVLAENFRKEEKIENKSIFSNVMNQIFIKQLSLPVALIIALNSFGITDKVNEYNDLDSKIIIDLEDYFTDPIVIRNLEDSFTGLVSNISPLTEEFAEIAHTPITIEQKINGILARDITYQEKFNEILKLEEISIEERIDRIIHTNITNYDNIFQFIITTNLSLSQKMEFILHSEIATDKEILDFIITRPELTVEQKVWYALLIPNSSFETVFSKLLTIEDSTQEQIIKSVIDADLVSFKTLFDQILSIENLTNQQFMNYLYMYHADYNNISLEEKVECIWNLMRDYSLPEKIQFILTFYNMTYQDYINLYSMDKNQISEECDMVLQFFEKVNQEKEIYILDNYGFESKEQLDVVVACCAAEGANDYRDLYYVSNVIFNRVTYPYYVKKWGSNPYSQATAPAQFSVYGSKKYQSYLNDSLYKEKYKLAQIAFYDMFYYGYDGIVHDFVQFRSWKTTTFSNDYIVEGGNRYGTVMDDSVRIQYENLLEKNNGEPKEIRQLVKEINSRY